MSSDIRIFPVTIPPGVQAYAPQTTDIMFPSRAVDRIQVVVPTGCNGAVGFAIGAAGEQVIPSNEGAWIIASGEVIDWPLSGYHDSGSWQISAYNVGIYPHTISVRFLLTVSETTGQSDFQPIPADVLSQIGG